LEHSTIPNFFPITIASGVRNEDHKEPNKRNTILLKNSI